MTRYLSAVAVACAFALSISAADAKPRHKQTRISNSVAAHCVFNNEGRQTCSGAEYRTTDVPRVTRQTYGGTVIGGRPSGCPHRYCGCGLRLYLGISDPRLNLAWNWARLFPRTQAQAGAAAVRHGHVMLLQEHISGTRWVVRDYNGGRGLSYIHERDVRGFIFVLPGHKVASR